MTSETQLQTYLQHNGQWFFVSTIERDSSACTEPPVPRYNETIVWTWDNERKVRGEQVAIAGDGRACDQHFDVCESMYRYGRYPESDE
jgi:hypothetical protein